MNRLQPFFYITFPTKQADHSCVLIDLSFYARIINNANFLNFLQARQGNVLNGNELFNYFNVLSHYKKNTLGFENFSLLNLKRALTIVLREVSKSHDTFLTEQPILVQDEIYLITEKFFWNSASMNLGSSRHCLLLDMQLKGIGRNPLAVRTDFFHAWGGQFLYQSLKAYVVSILLEGILPLGILKTPLITVANPEAQSTSLKSSAKSLTLREADGVRITQLATGFDPEATPSKEEVLQNFLSEQNISYLDQHYQKILFHYAVMLLSGLRFMGVTRENITLEGKLIDYEDITFDLKQTHFRFMLKTQKSANNQKFSGEKLHTSTIHLYLDAVELSVIGLGYFNSQSRHARSQIITDFMNMVKQVSSEIFIVDQKLLDFLFKIIHIEAIYTKGDNFFIKSGENVDELILNADEVSAEKEQENQNYYYAQYFFNFERPVYKDSFLQNFNQDKETDIDKLSTRIFKMLQLQQYTTERSLPETLALSSEVNSLLSQNAMIIPYQIHDGVIEKVIVDMSEFQKEYLETVLSPLNAKLKKFLMTEATDNNEAIIYGALITLPEMGEHCLPIKPTLIKKS